MKDSFELRLGHFLSSLTAVLIPMLILLFAFVIDAGVLFYRALPDDMSIYLKYPASAALGFAIAFPLLLTAVNSELLPQWINGNRWLGFPILFSLFTVIMSLLFFKVFSTPEKAWNWYFLVVFLSAFLGLIEYLYASLFVVKFRQIKNDLNFKEHLGHLSTKYKQLEATHKQLFEDSKQLNADSEQLKELRKQLTCIHCGDLKTPGSIKSHQARCAKRKPQDPTESKKILSVKKLNDKTLDELQSSSEL